MPNHPPLVLALPKGRILEELLPLLDKAGIQPEEDFFNPATRALRFATNHDFLQIIRVRAFDVASFVRFGAAAIGITGSDVIEEFAYDDLYTPLDFGIGRCRLAVAKLAAKGDDLSNSSPSQACETAGGHIRIATKYPKLAKAYFARRGIQAESIELHGAIELAPRLGLCSRIVDLVASGQTLKENGLVEVATIMEVSTRLIVSRPRYKTRTEEISGLIEALRRGLSLN